MVERVGILISGTAGQDLDKQAILVGTASRVRRQKVLQGSGERELGTADLLEGCTEATSIEDSSAESRTIS